PAYVHTAARPSHGCVLAPMADSRSVPRIAPNIDRAVCRAQRGHQMAHDLTLDPAQARTAEPVREYDIRGGGGLTLRAREWGRPEGPAILFVHGWSQCDMCWEAQVHSPLAERFRIVTFDNRGHGMSDKPLDGGCYSDERLWADDLEGHRAN